MFWNSDMSGYLMELIRDNEDFKEAIRDVDYDQKRPNGKKGVFKGDGSFTLFFKGNVRNFRVFLISHTSGYLMEQIRDNEEFKEAVRNVKNDRKRQKKH